MLLEKNFEDIICKYPELIENDLILKGRQVRVRGKIMDILFEDKFGQKLIVELKRGTIHRKHIGQVMEYEGSVLSVEDPTARIILIGNRVPPNFKTALDHHGIEWREFTEQELQEFLVNKKDDAFLEYFANTERENLKEKLDQRGVSLNYDQNVVFEDENIDWRLHESHLSIINNSDTLERVNYLRNKINQISANIEEGGRKKWMKFLNEGRHFASIGEFRKNGDFWVAFQLSSNEVNIAGHEVKSWGTTKASFIKFGPETPHADIDMCIPYIKEAYSQKL
ncbi:hypothetical protein D3OALGA1CA_1988 [Olavius algarvensis associated proteobacterium Delta 3]|nr:hypothetical protein D3OALGA1CA_1988 [Olavius algarvensis associated proteobacterium Delta 3]CAB5119364.1 hypothetical protein D3OALGB2SA_2882 [Olavius algarvensis associated proteobacterium Delta 3]